MQVPQVHVYPHHWPPSSDCSISAAIITLLLGSSSSTPLLSFTKKEGPTCTLDITLALCASEGIGKGVGVFEYVYVRSSGFLFECSWDQFH